MQVQEPDKAHLLWHDTQERLPGKTHAANRKPPAKAPTRTHVNKPGVNGGNGLSPAALDLFGNTDPYAFGF